MFLIISPVYLTGAVQAKAVFFSCLECYDNNKEGIRYERKDTLSVRFHLCNRIISIFASHNDHLYSYKSIRDIDYCGGCVICAFNCERVLDL